jgi:catechol 2,3-dioxygenase-like lactoylglutathione lyase family enzyme
VRPRPAPAHSSRLLRGLAAISLFAVLLIVLHPASAQPPVGAAHTVEAVGLTVSDMDRSVDFYSRVLTFAKVSDTEVVGQEYERLEGVFGARLRMVRMRLGDEFLELTEYIAPPGRPAPVDSRSNDRWFQHVAIVVNDMQRAYERLRTNHVRHASTGPQVLPLWNRDAGGIQAFYFRDPDGHPLEILQFPEGKGQARWHVPTDRLFLGIDHTAIVVGDTGASLRFYRDLLGMQIVGESDNFGTEQEHLNNVFGARLHITSLRAAEGPGIEFLEYTTPRDGRPIPEDIRANDLVYWQTRIGVTDATNFAAKLLSARVRFVSPGIVDLVEGALGFRKGFLVRDPDGHAIQITEN